MQLSKTQMGSFYKSCLSVMCMILLLAPFCLGESPPHRKRKIRKYQRPKSPRGVLRKHAEIDRAQTQAEEPYPYLTCPYPCVCQLNKIYCDGLDIPFMPKRLPYETEVLMLKENKIRKIWQKHLAGLQSLKHFNIKHNIISYIEPSAFFDNPNLNSLNLMDNRIRYLSPMTFTSQKNLQFLSLEKNRLGMIEGLFTPLRRLHLINLGSNRIREITENTFSRNVYLRIIDLHDNKIRHIKKHAFKHLPLLKFLVLRDNPLKKVNMDFKPNFHLELLDFTNCKLNQMVQGLPYSIKDLRIAENNITELKDDVFKTTKRIRLLVLSKNNIKKISDKAFERLWQLYDLHIDENEINSVPKRMPKTLHGLYADHNQITSLEKLTFKDTPKLEFLHLKDNKIKSLDMESFKGLDNLKSLDVSHNGLFDLRPMAFSAMSKLQLLDISGNPLDYMESSCFDGLWNLHILQMSSVATNKKWSPVIFKDMKHLLFLDLENSSALVRHMAENPYVLQYLRSIEDLNIMNGGLYGLPESFPKQLPHLKTLKLLENPWHCDRSIYWLTMWMRRGTVKFFRPNMVVCASPPKLKGKKVKDLLISELPEPIPPRKQTPKIKVVDLPFNHTLRQNITLSLNVRRGKKSNGKTKIHVKYNHPKKYHVKNNNNENAKYKGKKFKQKIEKNKKSNKNILSDSGLPYQNATDIASKNHMNRKGLPMNCLTQTDKVPPDLNGKDTNGSGEDDFLLNDGLIRVQASDENSGEVDDSLC